MIDIYRLEKKIKKFWKIPSGLDFMDNKSFQKSPSTVCVCGDIFNAQLKVIVYFTRKRYIHRLQQAAKYFLACWIQKYHLKHHLALSGQSSWKQRKGFRKFCSLRQKRCILPGAAGTHSVCAFNIHQNAKLLFLGLGLIAKN